MKAFLKLPGGPAHPRTPPAAFEPRHQGAPEHAVACREAAALPGFRPLADLFGKVVASAATAVIVDVEGGKKGTVRWRVDGGWHSAEELPGDSVPAVTQALKKIAGPLMASDDAEQAGEFVVVTGGLRRPCWLAVRRDGAHERMLVRIGGELPQTDAGGFAGLLGRIVPGMRPKAEPAAPDSSLPAVAFTGGAGAGMEGLTAACSLLADGVHHRAVEIMIESTRGRTEVHHQVDGVWRAAATLVPNDASAIVAVMKTIAGIAAQDRKGVRHGRFDMLIDGKAWPATAVSQAVPNGERLLVSLEYGRPKFKTLADMGMSEPLVQQVRELVGCDSGLLVVTTPKDGGLSTLFGGVLTAADRLLRDFVSLEDAAAPRPEVQNVRPLRWDAAAGVAPSTVLDQALREYPQVLATCSLKDPTLAQKLVEQANRGLLVIVGVRGVDAIDGISTLAGLGIDHALLGKNLLGAVAGRLVRKLCPKCREDYLPAADEMARLKIDPTACPTLYRAALGGCGACGTSGYLGRAAIFEIAAGRTVNKAVVAKADAAVIRQSAVKDGMITLSKEARRLVVEGITSFDEIQRVFRKA